MKLDSETTIYHNATPNEDQVKFFYFCVSNPEKSVSMDGRPLICPFHKVKHLPLNCPISTNTFLHLQPTRPCLIFRECRSLAIMPQGWVALFPLKCRCWEDTAWLFQLPYLLPFPSEEGVSSLVLCCTSLLHFNTDLPWLIFLFCFIIPHDLCFSIPFACTWTVCSGMQCVCYRIH